MLIFFIEIKAQNVEPISKPNEETTSKPNEEPFKDPSQRRTFCFGKICKCPKGFRNYNGICYKDPPVKCEGGRISGNKCICPSRTKLINGKCIYISI